MNARNEKIGNPVEKIRAFHAELRTLRRDIARVETRMSQLRNKAA